MPLLVDVKKILAPRRDARAAEHVDELAERLVEGETLTREVIGSILDRVGATPEDLQEACDRMTRRAELLATVKAAEPKRKRHEVIRQEILEAEADHDRTGKLLDALVDKYRTALIDLTNDIGAADRAAVALTEPANLPPPVAAKVRAAQAAADEASSRADALRRELPDLKRIAREAADDLEAEQGTAKLHPRDAAVAEQVKWAANRARARQAAVTEAEAAIVAADKALVAARRERDRVTAEVRTKFGPPA